MAALGFANRLVFFLVFLVLLAALQIFLSRRESRVPGLVLPVISFIISILYPLNMAVFPGKSTTELVLEMALVWLLANIPTAILLAIYFGCRSGRRRRNRPIDQMNIRDLE